ncbi:MAG: aldo/keto reductase [Clostridiaceae bacterium]|nr:aldo/keto reductase [Clostridiaceae bacterium]
MDYRKIGRDQVATSLFGMGCMRLPLEVQPDGSKQYGKIDEDEAIRMIRYAIDHGVTYLDTAYPYHQGNSERVVGKALTGGYRDKVLLATKMPVWQVKKAADFERLLNEQLEKLQTTWIDFYLLHALNEDSWKKVKQLGVLDFLEKARQAGKIRHIAFSFHDQLPVFKEIIDSFAWDMCQIQLNLLDEHYQAGLEGMHYAADRGISIVVMEPLRGGALAQKVPQDIKAVWEQAPVKRSPAEWAFRYLTDYPQVSVILSGVTTMEQLVDNIRSFADAKPDSLTEQEKDLIGQVQTLYRDKIKVGCTGCNYCMPCPSGVSIPDVFRIYNQAFLYEDLEASRKQYQSLISKQHDASQCVSCGQCEPQCPQNIPIIAKLAEAHAFLSRT